MLNRYAQLAEATRTVEIVSEFSRLPRDRTAIMSIIARSGDVKTEGYENDSAADVWLSVRGSCWYGAHGQSSRICKVLGAHQKGRKTPSWQSKGTFGTLCFEHAIRYLNDLIIIIQRNQEVTRKDRNKLSYQSL